ncbi:helix-turn-helix transcriptional regulator [Dactylosporangium sp. AC04546]|uniref:helix-turn-helix domain-containing protein n=1 Tax=Dactylosporangium sp. AC04546 TaxID=2862460 RepID=UPI001EE09E28|nr:helix-turn-helix transcriptional regulator [Dactylosporangium sp. AC04546]WVK82335.1 helix-turn-helix transcriptional regulator [Dactylosporangium sp. AC04546]
MSRTRIDIPALYAALDGARRSKNLSWRQLAAEVGCSPSTMTRLANGHRPDVEAFMALVTWLNMPAETFTVSDQDDDTSGNKEEPELLAQVGALLRARRDLQPQDVQHLQEVIEVAMRRFSNERAARNR